MTGSLWELALAMTVFVASHIVLSGTGFRGRLVALLGEKGFQGAYSLLALVLIVWVVIAYNHAPYVELWFPSTALRHLTLGVMPFAFILLVGGLTTPNPSAAGADAQAIAARGPVGMLTITRHPMMWAIALWGSVHLAASGDLASLIFFGGIVILALGGARSQDAKKRRALGEAWTVYAAKSSFVPFAALAAGRTHLSFSEIGWWRIGLGIAAYAVFLALHGWLFGVDPWPL